MTQRITTIIAGLVLLAFASAARADEVRLLGEAKVSGERITLGDVARVEGAQASILSAIVVTEFSGKASETTVSIDQVRDRLAEERVNLGRVTISGAVRCKVGRPTATPAASAPVVISAVSPEPAATPIANPKEAVSLTSPQTVRDSATDVIVRLSGIDRDDLRINFSDRDAKVLSMPLAGQRFEIEPSSTTGLGRVPLIVRKWTGGKPVEVGRVTADVSRRVLALVTVRPVSRGQSFTADDVEVREVYLQEAKAEALTEPEQLAGRESLAQLKAGAVVFASSVRSPVLVRKNEIITVQCVAGSLVIRTQARATEDGVMEQTIRARNEKSPGTFTVRVTGVKQGTVLAGEEPATNQRTEPGKTR